MKRKSLALFALLLCSGSAFAQYKLDTIVVRPAEGGQMSFSCGNLYQPPAAEVESLLNVAERSQVPKLSNMLMNAVSEACANGYPQIVVERSKSGNGLSWFPVTDAGYAPEYYPPVSYPDDYYNPDY